MKKVFIVAPAILLTSCAVTEFLVGNEEIIAASGATASGFGGYGALYTFIATTLLAGAKWYEHKMSAKAVIKATQEAKQELPANSKLILADAYDEYMPDKIQKYVSKVKDRL